MSGLAVDSIGAYPSFYGTDSLRTDSLTPVQYAQLLKQYEQVAAASPTDRATRTMVQQSSPSPRYAREEDHTFRNILIAGSAALTLFAIYKGGGNPIKGFGEIGKSISKGWNKLWGKTSSVSEGVTKELKAVVKDGNVKVLVPGKTESFVASKGDNIVAKASEYGIDLEKLMSTTKGNIKSLDGGTFILDGYKVTFNGNKITEIRNGLDKVITPDVTGRINTEMATLNTKIEEFIANARKLNKGWGKGFVSTNITTQIGDDILSVTRHGKDAIQATASDGVTKYWQAIKPSTKIEPEITKLTTLKRCDVTDEAVRAFVSDKEGLKKLINSKDFENLKLFTGSNAGIVTMDGGTSGILSGKTFKFDNGKLVGFYEGRTYYPSTNEHFRAFNGDHNKEIMKAYNSSLKKGSKIPDKGIYGVFTLSA